MIGIGDTIEVIQLILSKRVESKEKLSKNVIDLFSEVTQLHEYYLSLFKNLRNKLLLLDVPTEQDIKGLIDELYVEKLYGKDYKGMILGVMSLNTTQKEVVLSYLDSIYEYVYLEVPGYISPSGRGMAMNILDTIRFSISMAQGTLGPRKSWGLFAPINPVKYLGVPVSMYAVAELDRVVATMKHQYDDVRTCYYRVKKELNI